MPSDDRHTSFRTTPVVPPIAHIWLPPLLNTAELWPLRATHCPAAVACVQLTPSLPVLSDCTLTSKPLAPRMVRTPLTRKVLSETKESVFAAVVQVKLLKIIAGVAVPVRVEVPAPSMVTVPELEVKEIGRAHV